MRRIGAWWWIVAATCGCTVTNHVPSNRASGLETPDTAPRDDAGPISGGSDPGSAFDADLDGCGFGATLAIYPRDTVMLIDGSLVPPPSSLTYSVSRQECGWFTDVSSTVVMTVGDPTLGHFVGNRFVALDVPTLFAAKTTVAATASDASDATGLTVVHYRSAGDRPDVVLRWRPCDSAPKSSILAVNVPAGATLDVTARATDEATSPVSATSLVGSVRALSEGNGAYGCAPRATKDTDADGVDDTFTSVAGADVCFEIVPAKSTAPSSLVAWGALAVTGSPGSIAIDTRRLIFSYEPLCSGPK